MAADSPTRRTVPDERRTFVPRHLRHSSSLLALESLIQPSPALSTSDTLCSVGSGEIPIIFSFLTTNSIESSVNHDSDNDGGNCGMLPASSLKPAVRELARFSPMAAFFPMHRANNQDPVPVRNDRPNSINGSPSFITQRLEAALSPSCSLLSSNNVSSLGSSLATERRDGSFTLSATLASPLFQGVGPIQTVTSKSIHMEDMVPKADCNDDILETDNPLKSSISFTFTEPLEDTGNKPPCVTSSRSLSTIQFSSPHMSMSLSPSPSTPSLTPPLTPLSSANDKTPTQATFLQRRAALHVQASSAFIQRGETHQTGVQQSTEPTHQRLDLQVPGNSLRVSGNSVQPEPSVFSDTQRQSPLYSLPAPSLKHAQWLRDSIVELWIDQEGFRAICPKFFLASISNGLPFGQERRSSLRNEDPLYTTVAEFLPVTREEHFFHHAALDRPPALHRLTVNGDEGRDFITRQASLGLKENGVFYVQGTEDFKMAPPPGSGASRIVRLTWRFEYFVSSRKPGPRGKKIHQGEKVFKPLSFSCTPAFLSPKRAIKVNVLHVMKKTLLPNLVAQKLDPPDLPIPPGSMETCRSSESVASISVGDAESSPLTATPERVRASIQARKIGVIPSDPVPIIGPPPRKSSLRRNGQKRCSKDDVAGVVQEPKEPIFKRHRARSASEQADRYSPIASQFFAKTVSNAGSLVRPILPYDELSEICYMGDVRNRHSITTDIVNNVQVTVLPPAPRPRPSGS